MQSKRYFSCISGQIKQGKWDEAEYLISKADSSKIDLNPVSTNLNAYKRSLSKLISVLGVEKDPQILKPSFRWAQSLSHIYLDIKFSHRMDAAGCIEVYDKVIDIKENSVDFAAKCIHSNHKLKFELTLPLFEKIDPESSEINDSLTGRLELKLPKVNAPSLWPFVYSGEKPPNMSTWWDMQEYFKEETTTFQETNKL